MPDRFELRAREPVATCLIRKLIVPRVYFGAEWPFGTGTTVDVLAIDRDGSGDAHVVMVSTRASEALACIPNLMDQPAPYRWIAFLHGTEDNDSSIAVLSQQVLYAPNTAGRVGVIEIVEMANDTLGAKIRIAAERFPGAFYDLATKFSRSHNADIQFGG